MLLSRIFVLLSCINYASLQAVGSRQTIPVNDALLKSDVDTSNAISFFNDKQRRLRVHDTDDEDRRAYLVSEDEERHLIGSIIEAVRNYLDPTYHSVKMFVDPRKTHQDLYQAGVDSSALHSALCISEIKTDLDIKKARYIALIPTSWTREELVAKWRGYDDYWVMMNMKKKGLK
ncbi:RxLR-like protein [Plasmopara halstedii]|uniref:RxLR-like protein n=1 Tax=Plasmopara halstedii TaxID=4781 RepID=A0A0P1AG50_PLAHL|nr:RxLR-like protein [Plasmopara halstedii]CEG39890.1 RxLR-like protein [Plasmopara halstedii]|eukprot:XP_024576259.1 RxLR-like protein [Plasmopara halstedii]